MPTIRTIKPGGGGDYTSLDAWWAFAKTQSNADQWAELYGGEILGDVDLSEATFTPDATHYVRIYGAVGATHEGRYDTSKARLHLSIAGNLAYTRYERFIFESFADGNPNLLITSESNILIDGVYFYHLTGSHSQADLDIASNLSTTDVEVRNCLFSSGSSFAGDGPCCRLWAQDNGTTGSNLTVRFYNNSLRAEAGSQDAIGIFQDSNSLLDLTVENTISCATNGGNGFAIWQTPSTLISSNNMSEGGTVNTGFTATTASANYTSASDLNLKSTAPCRDAGIIIGSFSTDAVGITRPQGIAWDIGALEYIVVPVIPEFYLDPNGQVQNDWTVTPSGENWTAIDDKIRFPTAPTLTDYVNSPATTTNIMRIGLTDPPTGKGTKGLTIRAYGSNAGSSACRIKIYKRTSPFTLYASTVLMSAGAALGYYSIVLNNNFSYGELKELEFEIDTSGSSNSSIRIHEIYGEPNNVTSDPTINNDPIALYNLDDGANSTIAIDSIGGRDASVVGNIEFGQSAIANDSGTSASFKGGHLQLPVAVVNNLRAFSFECWLIWKGVGQNTRIFDFDTLPQTETEGRYYFLTPQSEESGRPRFGAGLTGQLNKFVLDSAIQIPENQRTYVVVTWESNIVKLYINAQLAAQGTTTITLDQVNPANAWVGAIPDGTAPFNGAIDKIAIYNRALTFDEIEHTFNQLKIISGLNDVLVITDEVVLGRIYKQSLSDVLNLRDLRGTFESKIDTLVINDSFKLGTLSNQRFSDTLSFIETVNIAKPPHDFMLNDLLMLTDFSGGVSSKQFIDTLFIADSVSLGNQKLRGVSSFLVITDFVNLLTPFKWLSDSLAIVDSVAIVGTSIKSFHLSDNLVLSDGQGAGGLPQIRKVGDVVTFTDSAYENLKPVSLSDRINLFDTLAKNLYPFDQTDALNLLEKLHQSLLKIGVTDNTLQIKDSMMWWHTHQWVTDTLAITDSVIVDQSIFYRVIPADTISFVEKVGLFYSPIRLRDSLLLTDAVHRIYERLLIDNLVLTDIMGRYLAYNPLDFLSLSDLVDVKLRTGLVDTLTLIDFVCYCFSGTSHLTDNILLRDFVRAIKGRTDGGDPGGGGIILHAVYNKRLADRLLINDYVNDPTDPKVCCS